ncbi:hypothetical protein [Actinomycetospora sp. NBRC 106378]|uniref:hypothetical protein n=1 Tax=Actinomycetospora sp. NBRC 106378 TaxID=3032208 RepID=UPI0024A352F6|nr:hypothetical protein [Actinomycetospora sp. NBRC 106378]GLZ52582.1 hypothetical protein Acsp07_21990 [Actinomycetospora sp. NBRC 106378]
MVDPAARRLVVVGVLRLHLSRVLGPAGLPRDLDDDALLRAAASLATDVDTRAGLHRVRFDPPYPGAGTIEEVRHGRRLVLRTAAWDEDGSTLGVVLTVLIPGREPQVQISPEISPA